MHLFDIIGVEVSVSCQVFAICSFRCSVWLFGFYFFNFVDWIEFTNKATIGYYFLFVMQFIIYMNCWN